MSFESELIELAMGDPERSAEDFRKIIELTEASDLNYGGSCIQTLLMPKIITGEIYDCITGIAAVCFPILNKVIAQYRANPEYRLLFGFEPELEELILLSDTRITPIPVSRIDFFLDEKNCKAKLCEINTDGTSAMNEDRILGSLLRHNSAFQAFMQGKAYRKFELFDSFVGEFLRTYRSYTNTTPLPCVAIVDFLDKGTVNEFKRFQEAFIRQGIEAEICDIRALTYNNSKLRTPSGMAVDAIYRRAVTADIMANFADVSPFIQAARDGAVCLVGGFCTQIAHNKLIFYILRHPATLSFLTEDERRFVDECIPLTFLLTEESVDENNVLREKDKWIIKPCDSYGSRGVYAGVDCDDASWERVVKRRAEGNNNASLRLPAAQIAQRSNPENAVFSEGLDCHGRKLPRNDGVFVPSRQTEERYLLQEFIAPHRTPNLDFFGENLSRENLSGENLRIASYGNTTGVFCYNEKPYGIYSRLSEGNIISTQHGEKAVATILLGE